MIIGIRSLLGENEQIRMNLKKEFLGTEDLDTILEEKELLKEIIRKEIKSEEKKKVEKEIVEIIKYCCKEGRK